MRSWVRPTLAVVLAVVLVVGAFGAVVQPPGVGTAEASHGGDHIDDFEDGNTNVETTGYTGWTATGGTFAADSGDPIEGTNSGKFSVTAGNFEDVNVSFSADTKSRVGAKFRMDYEGSNTDGFHIQLESGGTSIARVKFEGDNSVTVEGSSVTDTGLQWHSGVVYDVEFRSIDYANDQFDLYINGDSYGTFSFSSTASSIDEIQIRVDNNDEGSTTRNLYIDAVQANGTAYSQSASDTIEDFEDGSKTATGGGWSDAQGDTGSLTVNATGALDGSNSGDLTAGSGTVKSINYYSQAGNITPSQFGVLFEGVESNDDGGDAFQLDVFSSGGNATIASIRMQMNGTVGVSANESFQFHNVDWQTGEQYSVSMESIDYSADTFDLVINGETVRTIGFQNPAAGLDNIRIRVDANTGSSQIVAKYDLVTSSADAFSDPTFEDLDEGFEDSNLDVEENGWGEFDAGSINTSSPLVGSASMQVSSSGSTTDSHLQTTAFEVTPDTFSAEVLPSVNTVDTAGGSTDTAELILESNGTTIVKLVFDDAADEVQFNGGTVTTWTTNETQFTVSLTFDWSNDSVALTFDGVDYGSYAFDGSSSASGFDEVRVLSDTRDTGTSRQFLVDSLATTGIVTSSGGGGSTADTYSQRVELDSGTTTIKPQTANLEAYYITYADNDSRVQSDREIGAALDADQLWTLEDSDGFNFESIAKVDLHDGAVYDLRVYDPANEGFYAELFDAEQDIWEDRTLVLRVDEPQSIISCENYAGAGSCDPDDPASSDGPFLDTDGTTFTWYDPSGSTTSIDYNITFPDGSTYEFNESFDEPISSYQGNLSDFDQEPVEISWAADSNGSTYAGTLDWGQGGSSLSESGGFIGPVGPGDGGGGGIGGAPWWVWLVVLGTAGYFARDELSQAARNASPAVRRAASKTAGSVTKAAAGGARGAARAARRIIQR